MLLLDARLAPPPGVADSHGDVGVDSLGVEPGKEQSDGTEIEPAGAGPVGLQRVAAFDILPLAVRQGPRVAEDVLPRWPGDSPVADPVQESPDGPLVGDSRPLRNLREGDPAGNVLIQLHGLGGDGDGSLGDGDVGRCHGRHDDCSCRWAALTDNIDGFCIHVNTAVCF